MQDKPTIMAVAVGETAHAFRVNGVTIAKRHLAATIGRGQEINEKILAKYLVIVPFLATSYKLNDDAHESVRYGALKAKRIFEAIGISDDAVIPFMMVFMQLAEVGDNPQEAIAHIGREVREAGFYDGGTPFQLGEASLSPPKKTLH